MRAVLLFAALCTLQPLQAAPGKKGRIPLRTVKPSVPKPPAGILARSAPEREVALTKIEETREPRHVLERPGSYRRQFLSGFGMMTLGIPAAAFFAQTRFLVGDEWPLYVGAELNMALPDNSHYFGFHAGAWWEFVLAPSPAATLSVGMVGGPGFVKRIPGFADSTVGVFADAGISFEIDELATIRGQARPGIVDGKFAFSLAALIGFRFR